MEALCISVKDPFEDIISEDLVANNGKFNEEMKEEKEKIPSYDWQEDYVLVRTDVTALFTGLRAEKTEEAVKKQAEKTE